MGNVPSTVGNEPVSESNVSFSQSSPFSGIGETKLIDPTKAKETLKAAKSYGLYLSLTILFASILVSLVITIILFFTVPGEGANAFIFRPYTDGSMASLQQINRKQVSSPLPRKRNNHKNKPQKLGKIVEQQQPVYVKVERSFHDGNLHYWLIMTAFQLEYDTIKTCFRNLKEFVQDGIVYGIGTVEDVPCILCMTGISVVNAARSAQWMMDHFSPSARDNRPGEGKNNNKSSIVGISFFGIAGGLSYGLKRNDVSCPTEWINYGQQLWTTPGSTELPNIGEPIAFLPGFSCGSRGEDVISSKNNNDSSNTRNTLPNEFILKTYRTNKDGSAEYVSGYTVDDSLSSVANSMKSSLPYLSTGGIGLSAMIFLANTEYVSYLRQVISSDVKVVDQETFSVMHVAEYYGIPFICFRLISDVEVSPSSSSALAETGVTGGYIHSHKKKFLPMYTNRPRKIDVNREDEMITSSGIEEPLQIQRLADTCTLFITTLVARGDT